MDKIVHLRITEAQNLLENLLDLALFEAGHTPPDQCQVKLTWQNLALALEQARLMTQDLLDGE